ncbi:MAG TPA: hypothetical protein VFG37_07460 [Planctomycetota bacterium]|nr:hypothetical protein [Planctomycetota bacterium]
MFHRSPLRTMPRVAFALAVVAFAIAVPVQAAAPAPFMVSGTVSGTTFGTGDGKPAPAHTHTWVKQSQKEWVPPEKQTVQVGVDAKGKPVYETKIVKPGYWRTVTFFRCSCGQTKS